MNTTKKHLTLLLLGMIIILPIVTTSCFKKGSEDPFFSIYTRKARVTGDWIISDLTWEIRSDDGTNELLTTTTVTNGIDWKRTIQVVGTENIRELEGEVLSNRNKIIFYEDGRFTQTLEYEYYEDSTLGEDSDESITITTKVQETMEGTWNFLNNIDDFKSKERLSLVVENKNFKTFVYHLLVSEDDEEEPVQTFISGDVSSHTYANGEYSTIWTLRMLKNKQVIMDQDIENFSVQIDGNSYTEFGYKTQTLTRE